MEIERIAKAYEIITYASVLLNHREAYREVPLGTIRTDIVIGDDVHHPEGALLVTTSGSEVDYHKKFHRDFAETLEVFSKMPDVSLGLLIFEDNVLPSLLATFEASLGPVIHGFEHIDRAVVENIYSLLLQGEGLERALSANTAEDLLKVLEETLDMALLREIAAFGKKILHLLFAPQGHDRSFLLTSAEFIAERADRSEKALEISARHTRLRRGVSKLLLFDSEERGKIYSRARLHGDYDWAVLCGLAKRVVGENMYEVIDPEIVSGTKDGHHCTGVLRLLSPEEIESVLKQASAKSKYYVQKIRNFGYLDYARDYVCNSLTELSSPVHMEDSLRSIWLDSSIDGEEISFHWLYSYLVALFKAAGGRKNSFGATVIARLSGNRRFRMNNSILSNLEYKTGSFPDNLFAPLAEAMSVTLAGIEEETIRDIHKDVVFEQLRNEMEDKLLCHSINPLPILVCRALEDAGMDCSMQWIRSSLAKACGLNANAGKTKIIRAKNTIIWWRSAHERQNVNHKTKEIRSKVVTWRISWDSICKKYIVDPNLKIIMIIDGDFEPQDFKKMRNLGVDEFFFPDEMNLMTEVVV